MSSQSRKTDFDFFIGAWNVKNRRLKERLNACGEWVEFGGEIEVRKTLNGFANVDEYKSSINGEEFHAATMRVFNPFEKKWSIYWLDTFSYELIPQVEGEFINGRGEFYGEELFKGERVKLRFLWTQTSDKLVHWSQAYYDVKNDTWEINWTMDFSKII